MGAGGSRHPGSGQGMAGATLGIPGLYVTGDPGGIDDDAKIGSLKVRPGLGWAKSHAFTTGQCPVMSYNRQLMMAILHDKAHIADAVNATVISLDKSTRRYRDFDQGVARKFVIDPHGLIPSGAFDRARHRRRRVPAAAGAVGAVARPP